MNFELKTIEVEHPDISGEKMLINESGFDPSLHKLFSPVLPATKENETDQIPKPETDSKRSHKRKAQITDGDNS